MQANLFGDPGFELGDVEKWCAAQGFNVVVGVDEAGRGPLAGPVYAAAVALDLNGLDEDWIRFLDDSKKLKAADRDAARELIQKHAVAYAVCCRNAADIDEINILQATLRSMEDAIGQLGDEFIIDHVLVDGNQRVTIEHPQTTFVKGDGRSYAIAAASILAKVGRDEVMREFDEVWPEYGFKSNKGYGSQLHRDAIVTHGPCRIHRMTFGGVRQHAHRLRED